MPLKGLSFKEVIKKEVSEGKDPKQAVAIKYSYARKEAMKRAANKKKKDD